VDMVTWLSRVRQSVRHGNTLLAPSDEKDYALPAEGLKQTVPFSHMPRHESIAKQLGPQRSRERNRDDTMSPRPDFQRTWQGGQRYARSGAYAQVDWTVNGGDLQMERTGTAFGSLNCPARRADSDWRRPRKFSGKGVVGSTTLGIG